MKKVKKHKAAAHSKYHNAKHKKSTHHQTKAESSTTPKHSIKKKAHKPSKKSAASVKTTTIGPTSEAQAEEMIANNRLNTYN